MRRIFISRLWLSVLFAAAIPGVVPPRAAFAQQPPSASDLAQARELLNQGFKLRDDGDAAGALEKFKAAYSVAETPISATELGRAYLAVGKLVDAREAFLSVARIPHRSAETERSATARADSAKLAEELRARIPRITVKVTGASDIAVVVTVDGETVPTEVLAAPRFLNAGSHELRASAADGGTAEARVDLKDGETREVTLHLESGKREPPPAVATTTSRAIAEPTPRREMPAAHPGQAQRVGGLVVAGAGLLTLGAGGVMGLIAKTQFDVARSETSGKHADSVRAGELADAATIALAVGAVTTAVGAFLWLTAPKGAISIGINGRFLLLSGSFQ